MITPQQVEVLSQAVDDAFELRDIKTEEWSYGAEDLARWQERLEGASQAVARLNELIAGGSK